MGERSSPVGRRSSQWQVAGSPFPTRSAFASRPWEIVRTAPQAMNLDEYSDRRSPMIEPRLREQNGRRHRQANINMIRYTPYHFMVSAVDATDESRRWLQELLRLA